MATTNVHSSWIGGNLVFDQVKNTGGQVQVGDILAYSSADKGFNLGTRINNSRRTRAFVVGANDGGNDPTDRIESSCHMFTQLVDWNTGWSATALEGVFYGGYDLKATEDGMNVSGIGGWIYLDDEAGGAAAPAVGQSSGMKVYVAGVESFVALPADVAIAATGVVCGLKLSNKFASGMTKGSGVTAAIYIETVDTSGYDHMIATNSAANGFQASTSAMGTNNTSYAMKVLIGATTYYIPCFATAAWAAS